MRGPTPVDFSSLSLAGNRAPFTPFVSDTVPLTSIAVDEDDQYL